MENVKEEQEIFEVLGLRLKLKKEEMHLGVSPREVVELVQSEAHAILNKHQGLNLNQVSVLVALKLAQDKLALESEYKSNVDTLKMKTSDALQLLEEVFPSTI